jgi:hypothetical protein
MVVPAFVLAIIIALALIVGVLVFIATIDIPTSAHHVPIVMPAMTRVWSHRKFDRIHDGLE